MSSQQNADSHQTDARLLLSCGPAFGIMRQPRATATANGCLTIDARGLALSE